MPKNTRYREPRPDVTFSPMDESSLRGTHGRIGVSYIFQGNEEIGEIERHTLSSGGVSGYSVTIWTPGYDSKYRGVVTPFWVQTKDRGPNDFMSFGTQRILPSLGAQFRTARAASRTRPRNQT